ncbi:hypothetical protein Tco_0873393 [Tanacetum coccineum]
MLLIGALLVLAVSYSIHAANMAYYSEAPSTSGFPFPGRQDPTVQFEGDKQKNWQESAVKDDEKSMGR